MRVKKYLSVKDGRHRIRISDAESKFIFLCIVNRLYALNKLIKEYEGLAKSYEKDAAYCQQFPTPRGLIQKTLDKTAARLKKLRPQIQPAKIGFLLRLYDKLHACIGRPRLNPKYVLVRDDIAEWIAHPHFIKVS
jgi:hypothetical protein